MPSSVLIVLYWDRLLIPLNSAWIAFEINHLLCSVLLPHKPEDNLEELFPGIFGDRVRLYFPMMF